MDEYWNNCTCIKSLFDILVITCEDEMVNTSTNSMKWTVIFLTLYSFIGSYIFIFVNNHSR